MTNCVLQVTSRVWPWYSIYEGAWDIIYSTLTSRRDWSSSCRGSRFGSNRKPFRPESRWGLLRFLPWVQTNVKECQKESSRVEWSKGRRLGHSIWMKDLTTDVFFFHFPLNLPYSHTKYTVTKIFAASIVRQSHRRLDVVLYTLRV